MGAGPRAENVAMTLPVSASVSSRPLSSVTVTSLPASSSARIRLPSAWPIISAGMSDKPVVPFMTVGLPDRL